MYIAKCDRCGKEKEIKSLFPTAGQEKREIPKYAISECGEDGFKQIYLCNDCEKAFRRFLGRVEKDGDDE